MSATTRYVVRFTAPRNVEVVEEPLRAPGPEEVRVRTSMSAISPGTERLIYCGDVPSSLSADSSIETLDGDLDYPLTYGYSCVGIVEIVGDRVDDDWRGQRVFSFQPHASRFIASPDDLVSVPSTLSDEDAILIPSLETAVNFVMDGRPGVGERVVVFGQGVVGILTTALAARFPLECLFVVDPIVERRGRAEEWGADRAFSAQRKDQLRDSLGIRSADVEGAGERGYEGADLVYELSGKPDVLNDAISVTGYDGRILIGSWYGTKKSPVDLGRRFHRSRIQIKSSQVSTIDPPHRGRWSKSRRMKTVLRLAKDLKPGQLVTGVFPQREAETAYQHLAQESGLQPAFRYS